MSDQTTSINEAALFSDETEDYRVPAEPEEGQAVTIRFRTAKDGADHVYVIENIGNRDYEMRKETSDELFDFYIYQFTLGKEGKRYFFQVMKGAQVCYFNRLGATTDIQSCYSFRITPGFHTPEWAKGAVMYQIFVDRFCRGDESNDVIESEYHYIGRPVSHVEDWNDVPASMDVGRFYGGDLQGVWNKLDYLKDLGVEVIYFNPIFVSPSNHKYDCQDYEHIDPHYGLIVKDGGEPVKQETSHNLSASRYITRVTARENLEASDAFFARFMEEVHARGMKVILDGVFNHCGSFNKWLDGERIYEASGQYEPGAYVSADSPYRSYFKFYNENAWPYNDNYDGWWGHSTLPKLNYEDSPKLYENMMQVAAKWVSPPYSVDGWRLDVGADLGRSSEFNHQFWRDFRKTVKEANPEAIILAEHYGDPSSWLQGDQWDTVMNYDAFMEPLTWFLTGMEKHSDEYNGNLYGDGAGFFRSMNYHMSRMQTQSLMTAMNELSNHDHSRFMTRTNRMVGRTATLGWKAAEEGIDYGVFREGVMVQMTWPGSPTIYYGDETGVCGWTDPDNRRTYPWGRENYELIEFHKYMIGLHKKIPALRRGSVKMLLADRQLIAYGRMWGRSKCAVAVNNRSCGRTVSIPVWQLGVCDGEVMKRVMLTTREGYNVGTLAYVVKDGNVEIELEAVSSILVSWQERETVI